MLTSFNDKLKKYLSRKFPMNDTGVVRKCLAQMEEIVSTISKKNFFATPGGPPIPTKKAEKTKAGPTNVNNFENVSVKLTFLQHLVQLIYLRVVYASKKVLWTLHKKMQPILVFQQASQQKGSQSTSLWIRQPPELGKDWLPSIFKYLVKEFKNCKQRYKDLRFLLSSLYSSLDANYKQRRVLTAPINPY
jgi:hypothetical protein